MSERAGAVSGLASGAPWGVATREDSPWVVPGGPVHISPMRRRDLRSVLRIDSQQLPQQGWSVGLYLAELRRTADRCYLVARVDGRVAGFGGVLFQHPDAHVTTLAVDTAVRGRRVATRLMLELARRTVAAGVGNVTLEVRAGNVPAISLYRRFGLAPVGVRKGYYADLGEDALVMWGTDLCTEGYQERLAGIEARLQDPTIIDGVRPAVEHERAGPERPAAQQQERKTSASGRAGPERPAAQQQERKT